MVNNSVPSLKLNNGLQIPIVGLGTYALWNDKHAQNDVVPTLKSQLARLQLNYVDLYLIHWPVSVNDKGEDTAIDYLETWKGMEETVKLGLAKSIGVSNFNKEQLQRLLQHASIKPTVNQFEISPTMTQYELVDFCKSQSVVSVAYTPLGLISEARPEFEKYASIKNDPKIKAIAEKHGKSLAQIGLRYLVQRGIPVVPKSFTRSRIQDNINLFDFQLTEDEMTVVDNFNLNLRCVPATQFEKYTYFPFH
ncbi:aldo-keto reductase AKR2E4-like isoform X2 [Aricia agestis]|uniref:aldo-keto reductase AKR2E4-like isoform X2 n=1 Tax=Aricia agestis TaxID=91739 RepID=UPI001C202C9D|nr:aldo-keto reductase AKR2E4-like isoform X2 [Aricia agestis]